jgi:hypothetical protein
MLWKQAGNWISEKDVEKLSKLNVDGWCGDSEEDSHSIVARR